MICAGEWKKAISSSGFAKSARRAWRNSIGSRMKPAAERRRRGPSARADRNLELLRPRLRLLRAAGRPSGADALPDDRGGNPRLRPQGGGLRIRHGGAAVRRRLRHRRGTDGGDHPPHQVRDGARRDAQLRRAPRRGPGALARRRRRPVPAALRDFGREALPPNPSAARRAVGPHRDPPPPRRTRLRGRQRRDDRNPGPDLREPGGGHRAVPDARPRHDRRRPLSAAPGHAARPAAPAISGRPIPTRSRTPRR